MSDNTPAETPPSDEPQLAAPVVDAHTGDAVTESAPANAETQELIEQGGASEVAGDETPVTTDDWSASPEPDDFEKKSATKSKSRAAEEDDSDDAEAPVEPVAVPVAAEEEEAESPPENKKKWYAIKVQSGREDTIKAAILRKVAIEGLEDVFGQIMVPVEKVIEKRAVKVKDKKTGEYTTVERKVERKHKKFQGYIFAELEFNDRLLYLIRETSGVGDFLKLRPRQNDTPVPEPMSDAEVKQMLGEKVGPEASAKKVKIEFEKGDRVRIKEGSFKDSEGDVKEVILPKDPTDPPKVIVTVTFWGRPLDVELEYWQVTKS